MEMVETQTTPDKLEIWWGRLLAQPTAVCLIVAVLGLIAQSRQLSAKDDIHSKEMREVRQEAARERAARDLAVQERDKAQEKTIEAQQESIRAKDIAISELQRRR